MTFDEMTFDEMAFDEMMQHPYCDIIKVASSKSTVGLRLLFVN